MPARTTSHSPNTRASPRAVRSKTGCHTCRLRGKKCDEERIVVDFEHVSCDHCHRLNLECLGYGTKRPLWMRNKHKVDEAKKRIRDHLAAQGLIKGQPSSGIRPNRESQLLNLSDFASDREQQNIMTASNEDTAILPIMFMPAGFVNPDEGRLELDQGLSVPQDAALVTLQESSTDISHFLGWVDTGDLMHNLCNSPGTEEDGESSSDSPPGTEEGGESSSDSSWEWDWDPCNVLGSPSVLY